MQEKSVSGVILSTFCDCIELCMELEGLKCLTLTVQKCTVDWVCMWVWYINWAFVKNFIKFWLFWTFHSLKPTQSLSTFRFNFIIMHSPLNETALTMSFQLSLEGRNSVCVWGL